MGTDLERPRAFSALIIAGALTLILYGVPFLRFLAAPLLWLSTFAHEMGHGLAAVLVGGDFTSFQMWADGSGVATTRGASSGLAAGLVSAGGLFGPPVSAALLFVLGTRPLLARLSLAALGVASLLSAALVVEGLFANAFVVLLGAAFLAFAWKGRDGAAQIAVVFLAVQLSLSVFSRADYLFTEVAQTARGTMPSDVAQMATALGGPFWMWGALVALASFAALVTGFVAFLVAGRR